MAEKKLRVLSSFIAAMIEIRAEIDAGKIEDGYLFYDPDSYAVQFGYRKELFDSPPICMLSDVDKGESYADLINEAGNGMSCRGLIEYWEQIIVDFAQKSGVRVKDMSVEGKIEWTTLPLSFRHKSFARDVVEYLAKTEAGKWRDAQAVYYWPEKKEFWLKRDDCPDCDLAELSDDELAFALMRVGRPAELSPVKRRYYEYLDGSVDYATLTAWVEFLKETERRFRAKWNRALRKRKKGWLWRRRNRRRASRRRPCDAVCSRGGGASGRRA